MRALNCPNCKVVMEKITLTSHVGLPVHIDSCWPCHLVWFDHLESSALSPASVIALFRLIHAKRSEARNTVSAALRCVVCAGKLVLTNDLQKSGRFTYHRCQAGHGRISSVAQFLREKKFVRTLSPAEIKTLAVTVKQVKCSSCGGPIDLEKDTACTHCGAAIAVLDAEAVEKALKNLNTEATTPKQIDPAKLAEAMTQRAPPPQYDAGLGLGTLAGGLVAADLIEVGIAALVATLFS